MRNLASIPVLFLLIAIFGMLIALAIAGRHQQRKQLLERVANRFRGRVEGGDWYRLPQVRLRFRDYPALLKFPYVSKNRYHTQFTITWPDPQLRCEIYPQDIRAVIRKLWGVEDIEIGSPQFDAAYFISGNNKGAVRDLLTTDVQHLIFRLAALTREQVFFGGTGDVQVKWAGGVLTVTKPCYLSTFEALEKFVSLSAELFLAALASRSSGIEFVGEVREPDDAPAQCQVCGEPLATDLVYCASCHTPHHRECWEYFRGCSTYACGQKKYVRQPGTRRKAS